MVKFVNKVCLSFENFYPEQNGHERNVIESHFVHKIRISSKTIFKDNVKEREG